MQSKQEIDDLIEHMRQIGNDTQTCEVKEAVREIPKSLPSTISAFANGSGGTIILGLSEQNNFNPVPGFNAKRIYSALLSTVTKVSPPARMEAFIHRFENHKIVVAEITPVARCERPCYVSTQGRYAGSYIRTGDGDRLLTKYEVDRLIEEQHYPDWDKEAVEEARYEDLDPQILKSIVSRHKFLTPRVFGKLPDLAILESVGVVKRIDSRLVPTLAGLLVAGSYPPKYFPRLSIAFTAYKGKDKTAGDDGIRYYDTRVIAGPIPDMLLEALELVQKHMNVGAVIKEGLRREITDYPILAVREAVANALQHRDYSPEGRGSQVQINMYSDRLEITNPGGLFGAVQIETLKHPEALGDNAVRNTTLSTLLESTPYLDGMIVENRGTGWQTIRKELKKAGMRPPVIKESLSRFSVTFYKNDQTAENAVSLSASTVRQADTTPLQPDTERKNPPRPDPAKQGRSRALLLHALNGQQRSIQELQTLLGLSRQSVYYHLRKLVKEGLVESVSNSHTPNQHYRLTKGKA